MARPSITMPDHIADPYFCEDEEDFYKLCVAECRIHTRSPEEMTVYMMGLRIVLHEYLALILSKKMEPYEEEQWWVEKEKDGFKNMMHMMNEYYAEIGMPIYEDKDGKIKVDHDAIRKEAKRIKEEKTGDEE